MGPVRELTGRQRLALVAAICLLSAIPLSYRLFHPFVTAADNNTASFAQPARNLVRHGPWATRLGLAVDPGEARPPRFLYNDRHPPLAAAGAAIVFLAAGVHDWAARIYPALCSIASSLILFGIWRRHRGDRPAALAAVLMATLPAYGHFGKMLGEEAPTLMFGLVTLLLYQRWKSAPSGGRLAGSLAAYTAGCLSGWAAFHIGPLLIADAALTLRGPRRRRAVAGFVLAGLVTFVAILGHLILLSGSLDALFGAAASRTLAAASGVPFAQGPDSWMRREADHFLRLYGREAALLALVGVLAGTVAVLRRRDRSGALATVLILGAFGVAHPLAFRWAAYIHDWLLFHLLPILAIAAAEGILLLAALASGLARILGARAAVATGVALLVAAVPLAHRSVLAARGLQFLENEEPRFAWPLLGRAIRREAPGDAWVMVNFDTQSLPIRFYADRRFRRVRTLEQHDREVSERSFSLYVRDVNLPIEPALESLLDGYPCREIASYRLCDLRTSPDGERAGAAASEGDLPRLTRGGPLLAEFPGAVALTGYEVTAPTERPGRIAPLAAYLGTGEDAWSTGRVIKVRSFWRSARLDLPSWKVFAGVTRKQEDGTWLGLPILALSETKRPLLSNWSGRARFSLESAFLFPDGYPYGEYEVRLALYDGGRPVTPAIPGPPVEGLKAVVAGTIPLFTESRPAGSGRESR